MLRRLPANLRERTPMEVPDEGMASSPPCSVLHVEGTSGPLFRLFAGPGLASVRANSRAKSCRLAAVDVVASPTSNHARRLLTRANPTLQAGRPCVTLPRTMVAI